MVILPKYLQPGARLAVVSPAGPVSKDEVEKGCEVLRAEGFDLKVFPGVFEIDGFLAGRDEQRAKDLTDAFLDSSIDGIICTRGGYGSMRLLDILDFRKLASSKKPFIGFSDLTALQAAFWKRSGLMTFSGPQLARGWGEGLSEFSKTCWLEMLKGELFRKTLLLPEGQEHLVSVRDGKAQGRLLCGNLSMFASLCGTADQPDFKNTILMLEEIDEPLYRIDRMITQLRLCGAFDGIGGIILGKFIQHIQGKEIDQAADVTEILLDAIGNNGLPVVSRAPYGHKGDCWTLPFGAWATFDTVIGALTVEPNE